MAVDLKIKKQKEVLLEHLRTVPIVEVACKKGGISRATFYRWCNEDEDFKANVDNAKVDGVENINDMSEAHLIALIREKKYQAIALWLKNNHYRFMSEDKQNLIRKVQKKTELNLHQKELLKEALKHYK
jgi:cytidylate kinase